MRPRALLLGGALLALAAGPIGANAAELTPDYAKCIEGNETNVGWGQCSTDEIKRQEAFLAAAWKAAAARMKEMSPKGFAALLDEERQWIKLKDLACSYWGNGDFGREGQVLQFGSCKATLIAERVAYLKDLVKALSPD
jgi:uncharacterized protein YecT (DUF1311 family)